MPRYAVPLLAALVVLFVPSQASATTCSDYSNQADAQNAADTRDADGDGVYCESLPCPCATGGRSNGGGGGNVGAGDGGAAQRRKAAAHRRAVARQKAAAHRRAVERRRRQQAERRERLARQKVERGQWRVYDVVDGDTIKIKRTDGSSRETVRLIGLDTPETKKPGVSIECGGLEATAGMLAMTFAAATDTDADGILDSEGGLGVLVSVQTDRGEDVRDRYGRLLAYLDAEEDLPPVANGQQFDLGKMQITLGNSPAYRYQGSRFARFGSYSKSSQDAKAASRGVWGACGGNFHSEQ